jgi:putative hydrolase of the HAD superfamily
MARYPVVLFDVGETLVGPSESYGAVYRRVLSRLGVELETGRLDRAIGEASAEMARRIPVGCDRFAHFDGGESEFWRRFVCDVFRRASGRGADPRFARRAVDGLWDEFGRTTAWHVYEDSIPALEELRCNGTRLGIVSNWDSRLPQLLELLELAAYFDTVVVSHIEGVEKPDPALFRRALERLAAQPRQTLHVGNAEELDVAGARAAGIDAVLLDRKRRSGSGRSTIHDLRVIPRIAADGFDRG